MSDERAWDYCAICGRKIPVGEMCYGVKRNAALFFSGNTICKDCIAPENYELAPAANVRPVVRGRWEWMGPCRDSGGRLWATCTACGLRQRLGDFTMFCPNCGADMKGE